MMESTSANIAVESDCVVAASSNAGSGNGRKYNYHEMCEPLLPLKDAAKRLVLPYKTLLQLVRDGQVPAIDLNAHRGLKRPRFMVKLSAVQRSLDLSADIQSARRRAPIVRVKIRAVACGGRLP